MIRRYILAALYVIGLSALLTTYATILGGCGGGNAQLGAESARAAACEASEQVIEDKLDAEQITVEQAQDQIACVRVVCDELHERLTEEQQ